jgi:hypothetical protein
MKRRAEKVYISVLISDPPREHIEFLEARVQALEEELEEQKALRRQAVERVIEIEKQRLALAKDVEEYRIADAHTPAEKQADYPSQDHYPWALDYAGSELTPPMSPKGWTKDFGNRHGDPEEKVVP